MRAKASQKIISVFCSVFVIFSSFQQYALASGLSKITAAIYNSKNQNIFTGKAFSSTNAEGNVKNSEDKPLSDAYNYKSLSQSVDPRTGVFSLSYKVADITGNGFEDPSFPLTLTYSSLSSSKRFGLGNGWSWNLTYYDKATNTVSLSSGGSYKLNIGEGKLKYYKLKDLKVSLSNNFIILKYKDGREEQIDRHFGNLIKVTNAQGYSASFFYTQGTFLKSITYKNPNGDGDIEKLKINHDDNYIIIETNTGTDKKNPTTTLTKEKDGYFLTKIKNPLSQELKFSYISSQEKKSINDSLMTGINYPTGTQISIKYKDKGLASAKDGFSLPAVESIKTISFPVTQDNEEIISYSYYENSNTNYLGKGFYNYKEGEDTLFFTPNTYIYSTVESKLAPNGATLKTERIYNHFHQLIKENLSENQNIIQSKEYIYPDWLNKNFESLDSNYNFPIEIKTTYYNRENSRVEITKQQYDDSGNILKSVETSGIIKEYQYLSAEKTYNGIVHLPIREIESSESGSTSRITEYVYESTTNFQEKTFQRLKAKVFKYSKISCSISNPSCGIIYKTEINKYDGNSGKLLSLPSFTKILASSKGKCKVLGKKFNFNFENNLNKFQKILTDNKETILSKETIFYNMFTNKIEKKIDSNGIEVSYVYDALGRVIQEAANAESDKNLENGSQLVKTYTYTMNNSNYGGYGFSSIEVRYPNGLRTNTVYDSLGREIKIFSQFSIGSNFDLIKSYTYNMTGQKKSLTIYNKDYNGSKYELTTHYKYDVLGREINVTLPGGESNVKDYNDANNKVESYFLSSIGDKSPINATYFNQYKKPIKLELLNKDRGLYSKSSSGFDGFGNLIESIDVNNNRMQFVYSPTGEKLEEIFPDGRKIIYEYDVLYKDNVTKKSIVTSDGKSFVLGTRNYNLLGQLILDTDSFGKSIKYDYDSKGNISIKTLRSGNKIKYLYNSFNKLIKMEVIGGSANETSTFEYDPYLQRLLSMIDSTGTTNYEYDLNGNLKSMIYPDGNKISYEYDLQGMILSIIDIKGVQTKYQYKKENGKLDKVEFVIGNAENPIEKYKYDHFGRIIEKTLPNQFTTNYKYNELGGLESLSYFAQDGALILKYSYTYYLDMNIASRTRSDAIGNSADTKEEYRYDNFNNLEKYSCSGTMCSKDSNGNSIRMEEYSFDGLNNIKTAKTNYSNKSVENIVTYQYSNIDPSRLERYSTTGTQMQQSTLEYDDDGNIIKDGEGNILTYTSFQRLASFTKNNKVTEYFYNASGELVAQNDPSYGSIKFYYNGNSLLNESNNGIIESYLQISGRTVGKVTGGGVSQFFITDQAKSVIRTIEGSKLRSQNYVYTPYGQRFDISQVEQSVAKLGGIGFNGVRTDGQTGYQFLGKGYRAYNPVLGRFMQYDSKSPFGKGGINGYIFAENNPIMKFDPTGENAADVIMGIGLTFSILGIFAAIFTFGATLAPAIAGTTTLSAAEIGLSTASFVTGLSSYTLGISGQVYGKYASNAEAAGNKEAATYYKNTSNNLGWASLGMSFTSTALGLGASQIAARTASNAAAIPKLMQYKSGNEILINQNSVEAAAPLTLSKALRVSSKAAGYTSDAAWLSGKSIDEVSNSAVRSGDNETADYYGKIALNLFWISLGTGAYARAGSYSEIGSKIHSFQNENFDLSKVTAPSGEILY